MKRVSGLRSARASAGDIPNFYAVVYRLVAQSPRGKVTTYGQIARWLGHPSAARAVGYALHAVPAGSDIPWQRVINAAGRISSRCDRHYEAIQRALLEAEGVRFDSYGNVNLQRFGWLGPSITASDQRQETHQHQDAHQHQDDRDIPAQGTRVQATRHHRAQLPSQNDSRAGEQHRPQQGGALLAQRRQKRPAQAHQGRRQTGHEDDQDG
jgi:methylated-DNA-protein-cysteine methyltransferase-like protein